MTFKQFIQSLIPTAVKNVFADTSAVVREVTPRIEKGKASPPSNYELVFEDDFSERFLDKTKWVPSQPWGEFHADYLYRWWPKDETALSIEDNTLRLDLRYFPKTYIKSELPKWQQVDKLPEEFTIDHAVGLVRTKEQFKYGWFEADIKLPKQQNQWTAFWLMSKEKWPPEIDIFEAFAPDSAEDLEIESNIHYGETPDKKSIGGKASPVQNPTDRFVNYACHWTEDFIRFYIDGFLVREVTDKEILSDLSEVPQYLILNNGVKNEPKNFKYYSVMEVKNVKIYQNEGTILS